MQCCHQLAYFPTPKNINCHHLETPAPSSKRNDPFTEHLKRNSRNLTLSVNYKYTAVWKAWQIYFPHCSDPIWEVIYKGRLLLYVVNLDLFSDHLPFVNILRMTILVATQPAQIIWLDIWLKRNECRRHRFNHTRKLYCKHDNQVGNELNLIFIQFFSDTTIATNAYIQQHRIKLMDWEYSTHSWIHITLKAEFVCIIRSDRRHQIDFNGSSICLLPTIFTPA